MFDKMGGCYFFYYFTVQLHLLYACRKSKVSFITFRFFSLELSMQDPHPSFHSAKTLSHLYVSDPF